MTARERAKTPFCTEGDLTVLFPRAAHLTNKLARVLNKEAYSKDEQKLALLTIKKANKDERNFFVSVGTVILPLFERMTFVYPGVMAYTLEVFQQENTATLKAHYPIQGSKRLVAENVTMSSIEKFLENLY